MMHMLLFLDFLITFFYFWTESIMKRCMLLKNAHAVTFLLSSVRATLKRKKNPKVKKIYTHTDMMCFHKIRRTSRLLKGCKW